MAQDQLALFRTRCRQFQWLSWLMVGSIILPLAILLVVGLAMGERFTTPFPQTALRLVPHAFYLAAVWIIGQAMGAVARGDLFQPVLARALRRSGLALGFGGVFSVFLMTNLLRIFGFATGGYLHFDVPGMTLGMFGGALFLLGTLVEQARRVQAELDEMI